MLSNKLEKVFRRHRVKPEMQGYCDIFKTQGHTQEAWTLKNSFFSFSSHTVKIKIVSIQNRSFFYAYSLFKETL